MPLNWRERELYRREEIVHEGRIIYPKYPRITNWWERKQLVTRCWCESCGEGEWWCRVRQWVRHWSKERILLCLLYQSPNNRNKNRMLWNRWKYKAARCHWTARSVLPTTRVWCRKDPWKTTKHTEAELGKSKCQSLAYQKICRLYSKGWMWYNRVSKAIPNCFFSSGHG